MPVYREYAFMDADSVVFDLPAGFKPETVPPAKSMTTVFGEYHSNARFVGKQVIYTRKLKMNRGIWPKEQYTSLVDFYTAIVAADKAKLVIKEEPGN